MDVINIVSSICIVVGAVIMAVNIKRFNDVQFRLKKISHDLYFELKKAFIFNQLLIITFFIGYLTVLVAVNSTKLIIGNFIVSLIFLFGSIFVSMVILLQKRMILSMKKMIQDTLDTNKNLALNREELEKINVSLNQEIKKQQETQSSLYKSYDTQKIINKILEKALSESTVSEIVTYSLDLILSIPWLSFESQGGIYLVEHSSDTLVLKANRGLSHQAIENCKIIPFGKCLCGLAAQSKKIIYAPNMDDRHEIIQPGTHDHGHYCTPILVKGKTMGVINVHLKPGHKSSPFEMEFLTAVANTLAVVLMQKYEEKRNEEMNYKVMQSHKMEAMGTLAGGIAHDFNNILSGIFGYINLAEMNLQDTETEKAKKQLKQIYGGAKRAADLVQQILTFSRKTEQFKKPIRPYLVIKEALKFLRSSIPTTIEIKQDILSKSVVLGDPTQIHQIIMNLCTNAYQAIPKNEGTISVILENIQISDFNGITDSEVPSGDYLRLVVSDTGTGMDQNTLARIFEPYFTTKDMGEGTGLGLALVSGIVEDHEGYVKVHSELGKGTTFHVYFPIAQEKQIEEKAPADEEKIKTGNEHILIVDDDESIRDSTKEILEDYGYKVTSLSDGEKALHAFETNHSEFDLLITDITMPQLSGDKLIHKIINIRKDFPIIVCSGYSEEYTMQNISNFPSENIIRYFQKPLNTSELLIQIRNSFDLKINPSGSEQEGETSSHVFKI